MADTRLMCKHCGEETDHMHLAGKVCICSICGKGNEAPNWRDIQAAVEKRQKDNQAEVARRVPGKEKTMIKLTEEQNEEMKRRYESGESVADLAEAYKIHRSCVYDTLRRLSAKKPRAAAKPGRKAASPAPKAAEGPAQASGSGLRALIERVVDERINVRLAGLGLETLDSKVAAMVKAELVEALK